MTFKLVLNLRKSKVETIKRFTYLYTIYNVEYDNRRGGIGQTNFSAKDDEAARINANIIIGTSKSTILSLKKISKFYFNEKTEKYKKIAIKQAEQKVSLKRVKQL